MKNTLGRLAFLCAVLALLCAALAGTALAENTLTLPTDLTTIEAEAFEGLQSVDQIDMPGSVTAIGAGAFRNCGKPAAEPCAGASGRLADRISVLPRFDAHFVCRQAEKDIFRHVIGFPVKLAGIVRRGKEAEAAAHGEDAPERRIRLAVRVNEDLSDLPGQRGLISAFRRAFFSALFRRFRKHRLLQNEPPSSC